MKKEEKIHEAIGRIKERYPRVALYHRIDYDGPKLTATGGRYQEARQKTD